MAEVGILLAAVEGATVIIPAVASTIGTILATTGGAVLGGFGFAGGAMAFDAGKKLIEDKINENKKTAGNREIRDFKNPFANSRFFDHIQKRELAQKLIKKN